MCIKEFIITLLFILLSNNVPGFFKNITCKSRTHGNNNSNEIGEIMDNKALVRGGWTTHSTPTNKEAMKNDLKTYIF